jgi:hypothetical protein
MNAPSHSAWTKGTGISVALSAPSVVVHKKHGGSVSTTRAEPTTTASSSGTNRGEVSITRSEPTTTASSSGTNRGEVSTTRSEPTTTASSSGTNRGEVSTTRAAGWDSLVKWFDEKIWMPISMDYLSSMMPKPLHITSTGMNKDKISNEYKLINVSFTVFHNFYSFNKFLFLCIFIKELFKNFTQKKTRKMLHSYLLYKAFTNPYAVMYARQIEGPVSKIVKMVKPKPHVIIMVVAKMEFETLLSGKVNKTHH